MPEIDWQLLRHRAAEVAANAHAPYSGLHVGAAGLTAALVTGQMHGEGGGPVCAQHASHVGGAATEEPEGGADADRRIAWDEPRVEADVVEQPRLAAPGDRHVLTADVVWGAHLRGARRGREPETDHDHAHHGQPTNRAKHCHRVPN